MYITLATSDPEDPFGRRGIDLQGQNAVQRAQDPHYRASHEDQASSICNSNYRSTRAELPQS